LGKLNLSGCQLESPGIMLLISKKTLYQKKRQIYPLSRIEKEEVQAFVESQLKKSYIRPSKSLQTSRVLFVPKKNRKRRMVQDY